MLGFAVEGNAPPPKKITSWFLSKGQGKTRDDSADYIPHDIYVIGTQEDPLGEKEWLEILRHSLQEVTSMTFKTVSNWPGPGGETGGSSKHLRSQAGYFQKCRGLLRGTPLSERMCTEVPSSEVDRVLSPSPSLLLLKRIIFTSWMHLQSQFSCLRCFVLF